MYGFLSLTILIPLILYFNFLQEDHALNFDIYYNPKDGLLLDDRLFSPVLAHMPHEFDYQANSESVGHCGFQYGTNELNISDFLDSNLNWDQVPCEESSRYPQNFPPLLNVKDNGSGSDSDAEVANMITVSNSSNTIYCFVNPSRFCHDNNNMKLFSIFQWQL